MGTQNSVTACTLPRLNSKKLPLYRYAGDKGERTYSSYTFTTRAPDGGERLASGPGCAFTPKKGPRYPLDRRLGGSQYRSEHRA
jgi:hypothetical protein